MWGINKSLCPKIIDVSHIYLNMNVEDIKDNRPRGKGSKGPYKKTEPDSPIPDYIKLPDGRVFHVSELIKRQTGTRVYNLLDLKLRPKENKKSLPPGRKLKYTYEDRVWQASAPADAIAEKYGMSLRVARSIKTIARHVIGYMNNESEDGIIIDHTKT